MPTCIILLRGINVGGNKKVPMAQLRALAETLGYRQPRTLLQSGNLVLQVKGGNPASLEAKFAAACQSHFGLTVDIFARTAAEWSQIMSANPFPEAAAADPAHLLVMVLKEPITAARLQALQALIQGREAIAAVGRTLYIVFPQGIGPSRLTSQLTEKNLGSSGTGRNWNTVQKLAVLAAQ